MRYKRLAPTWFDSILENSVYDCKYLAKVVAGMKDTCCLGFTSKPLLHLM